MAEAAECVLLVEDDESVRFGVARHLERSGFRVMEADSCSSARERFRAASPDAVVTDFVLPDGEALTLITEFRLSRPGLPILVFTGFASIDLAVQAVKNGAHHLLTKPIDLDRLTAELRGACRGGRPARKPAHIRPAVLTSRALHGFDEDVMRLKEIDCSLLIQGETGTGKTVLARWLHEHGRRKGKPFVDLNCAGLARDLVEAELFGHERGAFTSAHAAKPGMFELANGGTLFLDEIGDIDLAVQPKILKAIEEKRFRRMGSVREQAVDLRLVSATHRDLREAARTNAFRADLYYRLSTVTITLPPLRERRADIRFIAEELLESIAHKLGQPVPELTAGATAMLESHLWPGNLRELKNVLERAVHLGDGVAIGPADLRLEQHPEERVAATTPLRETERAEIERALALHGHVGEAARSLGISRSSLYLKIKEYGLSSPRGSAPRIKVNGPSS